MMPDIDQFFDSEIKAIATDSFAIARDAAEELYDDVQRQIRRNFRNPSAAFSKGIKIHEFDDAIYVRLSPVLSSHARSPHAPLIKGGAASGGIKGNPNLWILLPDGARLGFKRMGTGGFIWDTLKRRYGSRLAFTPVGNGHVVLFRSPAGVVPIYKIQTEVQTKQRIEFYEKAEEIGKKYSMSVLENNNND